MASEERFTEVRAMLESIGYELTRIGGSHHIFTRAGRRAVTIPSHRGKVLPVYVRQVEKLVREEEDNEEG